ncbi:hypothetical protein [Streptomyces sp. NBC_01426]|uniref:hypothetical protein n=1 Tax=Streptomyces sp. NBC_01426 TaxID=2975866 RepID=UPI002E33FC2D|nr:hypothetical protein [Streptomyces sp. NBC_01426]
MPARRRYLVAAEAEFGASTLTIYEVRLYGASADELPSVVQEIPAQVVGTLMPIGHNPGVQALVLMLAGEADRYALEQAGTKFPTSAIAVLRVPGPWVPRTGCRPADRAAYLWRRPATGSRSHCVTLMLPTTPLVIAQVRPHPRADEARAMTGST